MKNPTSDTNMNKQQGQQPKQGQQQNWNSSKASGEDQDLNEKNFASRSSGLDDDAERDMDLSDDDDTEDMDLSTSDVDDTEINRSPRGAKGSQGSQRTQKSEGSQSAGRDSNRESTIGATRNDGPSSGRKQ